MISQGLVAILLSAGSVSAEEHLKRYDAMMGPKAFESVMVMVAHRDDDTTRTYQMKILKATDDKVRIWFNAPASAKGQEMLRQGENLWVYMPNVKKAIRLASRDSFQGGDFNNADVLRANLSQDFNVKFKEGAEAPAGQVVLECTAKTQDASYDKIVLWMDEKTSMPVKGEYYAASGKMLRSAAFSDVRDFHGVKRPAKISMRNELATKRYSELATVDMNLKIDPPATKFVLDDLGR
jgi:outer membrane lipoprotein-sorting protein